ncbi:MAG: uroporphyrinogen-III synthase [Burkholderiales bacterium]|jgi:uroporphyrinogen-III synthase|nr:uroporphyrinogen-III synthase [Betaproteobacteria bacterium]
MSLKGLDVIVTRPRESADATVRALNAAGATAVALPLLEISALEAAKVPLASPPDAIIFVSSHAAEYGVPELSRQRMIANAAAPQEVYAVGRATASRLAALGLVHVSTPASGEDSEALLAEPTFASPAGRSILIVKGASGGGGRQLLEDTLVQRGAIVYNLVCYRRELKTLTAAERRQLAVGVRNGAAVLIGSVETLESLGNNLAREELSLADVAHMLVPHRRVAGAAMTAGVPRVSVVSLEDNKLVETLSTLQA